jgi:hypothetical protein
VDLVQNLELLAEVRIEARRVWGHWGQSLHLVVDRQANLVVGRQVFLVVGRQASLVAPCLLGQSSALESQRSYWGQNWVLN